MFRTREGYARLLAAGLMVTGVVICGWVGLASAFASPEGYTLIVEAESEALVPGSELIGNNRKTTSKAWTHFDPDGQVVAHGSVQRDEQGTVVSTVLFGGEGMTARMPGVANCQFDTPPVDLNRFAKTTFHASELLADGWIQIDARTFTRTRSSTSSKGIEVVVQTLVLDQQGRMAESIGEARVDGVLMARFASRALSYRAIEGDHIPVSLLDEATCQRFETRGTIAPTARTWPEPLRDVGPVE